MFAEYSPLTKEKSYKNLRTYPDWFSCYDKNDEICNVANWGYWVLKYDLLPSIVSAIVHGASSNYCSSEALHSIKWKWRRTNVFKMTDHLLGRKKLNWPQEWCAKKAEKVLTKNSINSICNFFILSHPFDIWYNLLILSRANNQINVA